MFYKETVVAGKTIEVYRGFIPEGMPGKRKERSKITPEEMENINRLNSERKLRQIINANFGSGDYHLTLTYKKENRPDDLAAKKRLDKFILDVKKAYKAAGQAFKYIHVTEYENKAIHHHIIINNIPGTTDIINKYWKYGHAKFSVLDDTGQYKDLAAYLIKETDKTFRNSATRKQRYSHSRNLIIPVVKREIIKRSDSWHKEPKAPPGYYIEKGSLENGFNKFNGTPYQRYTLIEISKNSKVSLTLKATRQREIRKAERERDLRNGKRKK